MTDNAYHSPSAVPNNTHIPKIEQQSPRVNDSDPVQRGDVSQPLSHTNIALPPVGSSANYTHYPVPMNTTWEPPHIEKQCPPYSYPGEMIPTQHLKCEEQEEYPLSRLSSGATSPSLASTTQSALFSGTVCSSIQHTAAPAAHYPVPTYPNGYIRSAILCL